MLTALKDRFKNINKTTLIVIIVVAILALALTTFILIRIQNRQQALRDQYQTVRVQRGTLVSVIGATGNIRARQSATLVWKTSGTVEQVAVELGERVEKGAVLANLEQKSLPQTIISSQAELFNAKLALENLRNSELQYANALLTLDSAERSLADALDPVLVQSQAQKSVADARKALEDAERILYYQENPADNNAIRKAKGELVLAENALEDAKDEFEKYSGRDKDDPVRAQALVNLSDAQTAVTLAEWNLDALETASSEIDQEVARANVAIAEAQLEEAEEEWERVMDGLPPGDIALARAQVEDARRELERLERGEGVDPAELAAAEARVAAAESALETATITAPFSGTITKVEVLTGDQVSQGMTAFRLDDFTALYADLQVSEVDINQIKVGQPVTITLDALLAQEYSGEVAKVDLAGTNIQGVINYQVTVVLENPDAMVLPGMTTAANIVVSELENVLLIPNRAVRVQEGDRVVYVIRNGELETVEVELGASSDTESEVVGGELRPGDEVVLNPPFDFQSQSGPPPAFDN